MIPVVYRWLICFFIFLFICGCASSPSLKKGSCGDTMGSQGNSADIQLSSHGEKQNAVEDGSLYENLQDENQTVLDAAMEFYQTANEFWEQGDLENALNALDESYALILEVGEEADEGMLQQKQDLRFTIAKRIMEVYASRFNVANGNQNAIPMVMNTYVEKALESFKGKERKFFMDSYVRSGQYRPAMVEALRKEGLPEELSWLPLIESGFKTRALSRARALGLWQFIASTGYKYGLERNVWIDQRMDPGKSTQAAIAYLKELHGIFGDWTTALAAYNCGEGKVLKVIKRQKIKYLDDFWDLFTSLPYETASYVPRFIAVLFIVSDPEKYGFTLPPVDKEVAVEEVTIDKQVHLRTIAQNIGISYEDLKELNPELRQDVTPKNPYSLKVPEGKVEMVLAKMNDIPIWVPPVPPYVMHKVRKGESLSVIASKYRTSVRAIMAMNGLKSSSYIRQGWRLNIPANGGTSLREARSSIHSTTLEGNLTEYVVKKGDSLWKIAERFRTTTKAIQSLNQLRTTRLTVGQVLLIPKA